MGDGELDFSNHEVFKASNIVEFPSCSMDSFFDDLLTDNHACMHTHTCNPPGADLPHTHTCFHVHTKVLSGPSDDKVGSDDTADSGEKKSKKGNKEATRRYRERRKAQTAFLNKEVKRLEAVNQQLMKRLQGQAALEAENVRLKCLLVDIRGRIEGEIGSFPYQKPVNPNTGTTILPAAYVVNPCNMQGNDQVYCLHPGGEGSGGETLPLNGQALGGCEFERVQCLANQYSGLKEPPPGTTIKNSGTSTNPSGPTNRKGRRHTATTG